MDINYIGIRFGINTNGGGAAGGLTTIVLDSDTNPFTVTNRVYNSGTNSFVVAADVKDSDANDFTIFT